MGSRRQEERNEKIIRGLMKLPPNRRCINCNSLGPQYVCTTFWTFVCMACSGIHREFTHRVKSVSMAKFTSQEVEALQNGGNQRAREIYLNGWDPQRQRFPDSSNADKVREFIKNVYLERKYAVGKTSDKLPTDIQRQGSLEDATRRASSYHSYSQSPPYDYQYEERRYGKQASGLIQKSSSTRSVVIGKASSFVFSPGRYSDHIFEDRFANEGSASRASDFSVSSAGDPFRSAADSPTSQKEMGFSSPTFQSSKNISSENVQHQMTNLFPDGQPQRTTSFGGVRSFDSNSMSPKSCNSGSLFDAISETDQTAGTHQTSTLPPSPAYGGLDLFQAPIKPAPNFSSVSSTDLFQPPHTPSAQSIDMFQASPTTQAPSVDFFAGVPDQQQNANPAELSLHKNEGWATFDSPQPAASPVNEIIISSKMPSNGDSSANFEGFPSLNMDTHWPLFQSSAVENPVSSISRTWYEGSSGVLPPVVATTAQPWNAFDDGVGNFSEATGAVNNPSPTAYQHVGLRAFEESSNDGQPPGSTTIANNAIGQSYTPSNVPVMDSWKHTSDCKSTNPFDLPYDAELEQSHMFLDMSTLQAALPNFQTPPTFLGDVAEPWFPQNPVTPYMPSPAGTEGGVTLMAGQAPSSQLPNVQAQEPIASIGGNPFA